MGGGDDVYYSSPGQIDLKNENPALYGEVENLQKLRNDFRGSSAYALNPSRYADRMIDSGNRAATSVQNQMAAYGMAGSSAAVGAGMEAQRQNRFAWDDRMLNDQIKALQVEQALSGQIGSNISAIQNQFGQTQSQVMNAQQQANAQEQAMWGQIIGAGAMIGGTLLAGPAGGAAAGGLAGGLMGGGGGGGGSTWQPTAAPGGGYSVGQAAGMYGGNPGAYGYGGYY